MRALIVDDSRPIAADLGWKCFDELGFEAVDAGNGREALEVLQIVAASTWCWSIGICPRWTVWNSSRPSADDCPFRRPGRADGHDRNRDRSNVAGSGTALTST